MMFTLPARVKVIHRLLAELSRRDGYTPRVKGALVHVQPNETYAGGPETVVIENPASFFPRIVAYHLEAEVGSRLELSYTNHLGAVQYEAIHGVDEMDDHDLDATVQWCARRMRMLTLKALPPAPAKEA